MIKHIVMWNMSGQTAEERSKAAQVVKEKFEGLRDAIPGLIELEIGIDESAVDYACDIVLYSVFDSREALAAYANHPLHLKVREDLGTLRIARHQVDYRPAAQV
ncbi:Dabb family protein [Celeribacter neptunius]|uniref:Stress responsive A/B Barrel Domain n=1 Tax=Celeribacter neptunius TaxID=588602 RepID=A0A1I3R510_9RHOB|nr:Dabb family protein [Celeribacter neptunius]SFJ40437.1 Stress responsive A/B Barrel Domain [Celeribacter neptunius]